MVLSLVSAPLFLHELGSNHYGLLALLTALVTPFGLLEMGMSEATVKYVSESLGLDDFKQAVRYINTTLCFNIMVGIIGGVAIISLANTLTTEVFKIGAADRTLAIHCIGWVALNWAFTRIRQTFLGVVSALRNYKAISMANFVYQLTYVSGGLAVLFLGSDLLTLVKAQAIISFVGAAGWFWLLRVLAPQLVIRPVIDGRSFNRTIRFGGWQLCNNLGDLFIQQAQRWQLGAWLSVASVGYYNLSYQLAGVVYSVSGRVGQVFFPEISRLQGRGGEAEAASLLVRANGMLSCIQIPCYVVLFTLSHDLLRLWAGLEVANAAGTVLRILCLGLAVASLFAVPSFYLLGIGKPKWLAIMAGIQGVITVGAAILLIPRMGIEGAAWALSAGTCTHVIILLLMWCKFLRPAISLLEYLTSTFGSLVCGLLCAAVFSQVRPHVRLTGSWVATIGAALIIGALSLGVCMIVSLLLPGGHFRLEWLKASLARLKKEFSVRFNLV